MMKTPKEKVLYINIEKQYFDRIKSGEKDWESREYKEHWIKRLMNPDKSFKTYDLILFQNGYHTNAPRIWVEFKGVKIVKERKGLFKVEKEFEIELGKIVKEENT